MQKTHHYLTPLVNVQGRETHILNERVSETNLPELGIIIPLCNDLMIYDRAVINLILNELEHHIANFRKQNPKKRMPELVALLNAFQALSRQTINCQTHQFIMPKFYFEIPEKISQLAEIELAKRRISNGLGRIIKLVPGTKNEYTIDYEKIRDIKKPRLLIDALYRDLGITSTILICIIAKELKDEILDFKMVDPSHSTPEFVALLKGLKALSKKEIVEDFMSFLIPDLKTLSKEERAENFTPFSIPEFDFVISNELLKAAEHEMERRRRLTIEIQYVPTFLTKIKGRKFLYQLNLDILEKNKLSGDKIITGLCEDLQINDLDAIRLIIFNLKPHIKSYNTKNHLRNKPELVNLLRAFRELANDIIYHEEDCEIYKIPLPNFNFEIPEKTLDDARNEIIRRNSEKFSIEDISENFLIPNKNGKYTHTFSIPMLGNYSGMKIIMKLCEDLKINDFEIFHAITLGLKREIDAYQTKRTYMKNIPELIVLLDGFMGLSNKVITYNVKNMQRKFTMPKFKFDIPDHLLQEAQEEMERRKMQKNSKILLMPVPSQKSQYLLSEKIRNFDTGQVVVETLCENVGITSKKTVELIITILEVQIGRYNSKPYDKDKPELIDLLTAFKELSWKDIIYEEGRSSGGRIRTPKFSFEIPHELLGEAQEELLFRINPYSEKSILGRFLIPRQGQSNQYELQARIAKINIIAESIITILSKELDMVNDASIEIIVSNLTAEMKAHDAKPFGQRAPELVELLNAFKGLSERVISIEKPRYSDALLVPEFSFEIPNEILQEAEIEIQRRKEVEMRTQDLDKLLRLFNRDPDRFQQEALAKIIDPTEEQREALLKLYQTFNELVNDTKDISHEKTEMLKQNSAFMKFFENIYYLLPKDSEIDVADSWINKVNSEVESPCDKSAANPAMS